MARGVRKTPLEKLQAELLEVQATIVQIELEEFKEFKSMLGDQGMTMDDIKELVSSQNDIQQSA